MSKLRFLGVFTVTTLASFSYADTGTNSLPFYIPTEIGARAGFSANKASKEFHEAELTLGYYLPWSWTSRENFTMRFAIDSALGWLGDGTQDGAIISAGPALVINHGTFPVFLRMGSSPTYLGRHEFLHRNLGSTLQFTSHIGLVWNMPCQFQASYRFHHISNAGFASPNPGLNMHLFGLGYAF